MTRMGESQENNRWEQIDLLWVGTEGRKVGVIKKKKREKDHKEDGKVGQTVINTELDVSRSFFICHW